LSPRAPRLGDETGVDLDAPILPAAFYRRPTLRVAKDQVRKIDDHRRRGARPVGSSRSKRIGPEDRAAHTAGGRRTARNEVM
jgi:DNA-3-methyladenine glycosylase